MITSMLFGLFFGAGNLIFPIYMGYLAGENMWKAGNTYTYNIVYTPQELRITSVSVQTWKEVHGGDVIINHK